jgi:hypothetical protein
VYVRDCSGTWEDDEPDVDLSVREGGTRSGSGAALRFVADVGARSFGRLRFASCSTPICVEVNSCSLSLLSGRRSAGMYTSSRCFAGARKTLGGVLAG